MTPLPIRREVCSYGATDGSWPFEVWLRGISDAKIRARIIARLLMVGEGSFGDFKMLDDGVYEARIHYGAGWRLYFGLADRRVIFLWGGTKQGQERDIKRARIYWREYESGKAKKAKKFEAVH